MKTLRYLQEAICEDLRSKLVFLGGPRQVGKTTLAKTILQERALNLEASYRNWDIPEHRREILQERLPSDVPLIVLDEIHKFVRWRGLVKGFYDAFTPSRTLCPVRKNLATLAAGEADSHCA